MAENPVHASSFRRFLKTVGIDSDSSVRRSASLPLKANKPTSTFYSYSTKDLAGCDGPSKCGWLLKQSRGVLRSWQDKWFALSGNYLMQFASDDETQSPQLSLFLKDLTVKELATPDTYRSDSQKFLFEISPNVDGSNLSQETLTLAAKSPDERRLWLQFLRQVLYRDAGGGIFGQPLEDTLKYELERDPNRQVPEIVQMCVEFLYANGLEVEGIFRLPGRAVIVRRLRDAFDTGGSRPSLDDVDVHTVASLLKSYLCGLPQPVIPFAHYDRVMHIVTRERPVNPEAAIAALSDAIQQLPCANYDLLHYLCAFLHDVACCELNQMTASNLATVFSACFISPEVDDPALLAGTSLNRKTAVQDLIEHFYRIFPANDDSDGVAHNDSIALLTDVSYDVNSREAHCSLNGTVTEMPPVILVDANDSVEKLEENAVEKNLTELQSNAVNDDRVSTSDCILPQPSQDIASPVTDDVHELHSKVVMLQQQLQSERCSVDKLRQQLLDERSEAARQTEVLAKKLEEEQMATSSAVMRVMDLQKKLMQYSEKFGPLD